MNGQLKHQRQAVVVGVEKNRKSNHKINQLQLVAVVGMRNQLPHLQLVVVAGMRNQLPHLVTNGMPSLSQQLLVLVTNGIMYKQVNLP